MKKNRLFLYILLTIVSPISIYGSSFAEDCGAYIRLVDASGFDSDSYQEDLETATCNFIQQYPELQDSFKVFDYGFYQHQENFQGSFPDAFEQKMDEVANLSPYYLLFGKQTDKTGIYTRFWVDLKLPASGQFECLDLVASDFRDNLEKRINNHVNNVYEISGKIPENYAAAEIATLTELIRQFTLLSACCDPGLNPKSGEVCYNNPSEGYDVLNEMIDSNLILEEIIIIEDGGSSTVRSNNGIQKNLNTLDISVSFRGDSEVWNLDQFFQDILIDQHVAYYQQRMGVTPSIGKHYYKYPRDRDFKDRYQAYLDDDSNLKFFIGVINVDGRIGIMGYHVTAKENYQELVKDEIVAGAIQHELDEILALGSSPKSISELTIQHLHASNTNSFENLIGIDDNFVAANYQLVINRYQQRTASHNSAMLDRYQQLWRDEYNYYLSEYQEDISYAQQFATSVKVSWNMGTYAIHGSELVVNYARMKKEVVLELLLDFHCARDRGETSFTYLQAGRIKPFSIFRKAHLASLLEGINIRRIELPQPDAIYSISLESPTTPASFPNYLKTTGTQNGWDYGITIVGAIIGNGVADFGCTILTRTLEQAQTLADLFNNGLPVDSEDLYSADALALSLSIDGMGENCTKGLAKKILASAPICTIDQLSNKERIKLINCLASERIVSSTEEVYLIKLLSGISAPCDFINWAERKEELSVYLDAENLIDAVDNKATGGALIEALYSIFHDCNEQEVRQDTTNAAGLISMHSAKKGQYKRDAEAEFQSKVEFTTIVTEKFDNIFNEDGPEVLAEFGPFKLFDPVMMVDDIDIEGLNLGFGLKGMGVPAVTVPIILHYYDKKQLREALGLGAEIAFLALGGGELVLAYRAYALKRNFEAIKRLGVAVLDVGAASIELYCRSNPNTVLCEKWKGISPFIAAGLITASSYDLLKSRPNDLEAERIEDVIEVGARMSLIEELSSYPKIVEWLEEVEDIPLDVLDRLENIDNGAFFQRLQVDFSNVDGILLQHLKTNPGEMRAYEILALSSDDAILALRNNPDMLGRLSHDVLESPGLREFIESKGPNGFWSWKYADDAFPSIKFCGF